MAPKEHVTAVKQHMAKHVGRSLSVGVATHGPLTIKPHEILIHERIQDGGRIWTTVPVEAFADMFGHLFVAGKPDCAAFEAACDKMDETGKEVCLGYCENIAKWEADGILKHSAGKEHA